MALHRQGFTLMEIIVVLVIIGVIVAFFLPNYNTPMQQARAANAQNNLLAIYSAQKNYYNNNGNYCYNTGANTCADTLADINTNLSLNIQDDGTYLYQCPNNSFTCTATRNIASSLPLITVTLNVPINLNGEVNPSCQAPAGNANWCP